MAISASQQNTFSSRKVIYNQGHRCNLICLIRCNIRSSLERMFGSCLSLHLHIIYFPTYYDQTTLMGLLVLEHEMVNPTSEFGHVQFLEYKIFSKLFSKQQSLYLLSLPPEKDPKHHTILLTEKGTLPQVVNFTNEALKQQSILLNQESYRLIIREAFSTSHATLGF